MLTVTRLAASYLNSSEQRSSSSDLEPNYSAVFSRSCLVSSTANVTSYARLPGNEEENDDLKSVASGSSSSELNLVHINVVHCPLEPVARRGGGAVVPSIHHGASKSTQ